MTWWMWTILTLVWLLSLFGAFVLGNRRFANLILKTLSKSIDDHRTFMSSWMKINNEYVNDLAHLTLGKDEEIRTQNIKLLARNRILRTKVLKFALKYRAARKSLRQKSVRDHLDQLYILTDYIHSIMKSEKK